MMNDRLKASLAIVLAVLLLASSGWSAEEPASPEIAELLDKVPAQDAASRQELCEGLVGLGDAGIRQIVGMLVEPGSGEPGTGGDTRPRMALHALAIYVSRPGAETERRMYTTALLAALGSEAASSVKAFLIRQLRLAGGEEVIAPLGELLLNEDLCEPAAQTLLSVPADGVAAVFRQALPESEGKPRVAIIKALGRLRDRSSVPILLKDAKSEDRSVRLAALYALANIGDPAASEALQEALNPDSRYEKALATGLYLVFLERLAEGGRRSQVASMCRELMEARPKDEHVQIASLTSLARILGPEAFDDLLTAMRSENNQIRITARGLAVTLPGEDATRRWIAGMMGRPAGERVDVLMILGDRADRAALPALLEAAKDPDETVRIAALEALGQMPDVSSIAGLIAALTGGTDKERRAARASLGHIPGEAPVRALNEALAGADAGGRVEIVRCLAERGPAVLPILFRTAQDNDESVRIGSLRAIGSLAEPNSLPPLVDLLREAKTGNERRAAESAVLAVCRRIEDTEGRAEPLLSALEGAGPPSRSSLLGLLSRLGGGKALDVVRNSLEDENEEVRDAAIRALCDWPDAQPRQLLLDLAKAAPKETHRILALRGYVRMVGLAESLSAREALGMYESAMETARRPDGKKLVLAGVARVVDPEALKYAQGYLEDEEFKAEAEAACVRVAASISGSHRDEAKAALQQIVDTSGNERLCGEARAVLSAMERSEDYITAWLVSGPYTRKGREVTQLFDIAFAPEDPDREDVQWRIAAAMTDPSRPWLMDLQRIIGGGNRAAYLRTNLYCPTEQEALLELGSDDGIKVWLNGEVVHANNIVRGLNPEDDQVKVVLKEGKNTLLVKITQGGGDWSACARARAVDGTRIEGLQARID